MKRVLLASLLCAFALGSAHAQANWPKVELAKPSDVKYGGDTEVAFQKGIQRLALPPYSVDWLLADVSFKVNRIFTSYSGDVSGRFLELATLTAESGGGRVATLEPVLEQVAGFQRADGHFGGEMDFSKPMPRGSPPVPMLWGNARLLVGLVAAARSRPELLPAAKKLGDFYVNTAGIFCSPEREAELRATGTGGDSYTCCYFPAIEGLALLYRATSEPRYLKQAERMAEWFTRFDALPTDHSHGNLCAWRGILELYDITGRREYLQRAAEKWQKAASAGYVWSLGGVGEHWYIFHVGDEGCSESDWLRFNTDLWRFTGETKYLDMAERLLRNQYMANQCPNGGYGWRNFDGDKAGPIGTRPGVAEWNFCCSFHGPLGLHFLRGYLATGTERAVLVNFPMDFTSQVASGKGQWTVSVTSAAQSEIGTREFDIEVAPAGPDAATSLWLRRPAWASAAELTQSGAAVPFTEEGGYLKLSRDLKNREVFHLALRSGLRAEGRQFKPVEMPRGRTGTLSDVAVLDGPDVLFASPVPYSGRATLLAFQDAGGRLTFPRLSKGGYATVTLASAQLAANDIVHALATNRVVVLRTESTLQARRRSAFQHDLLVCPVSLVGKKEFASFAARAANEEQSPAAPTYGERLESTPENWLATGWEFSSNGIHVISGDVGLLEGEGYKNYRFEFDLRLPAKGQGVTGWVVRANGPDNCIMFQLQSSDSTYNAPQYKTRPNTLRPHVRKDGVWTIAEPLSLQMKVVKEHTYRVAVECLNSKVSVFLDGAQVYTGNTGEFATGSVGFRAVGGQEQGLFSNVSLKKL